MYHLIMVVMAITLSSFVIAGGVQYLDADREVSTDTSIRVVTSYRAIEMAFGSYRMANNGALPDVPSRDLAQSDTAAWRDQISPYAVGAIVAPTNLAWSYGSGSVGEYVCLSNAPGANVSKGMQDGLVRAGNLVGPAAVLSKACGSASASPTYDGVAALTFVLKAGG